MKKNRQERILELIQEYDIGTQEELAERLREEGFPVTQATVSRDIRELGLSKASGAAGGQRYVVLAQEGGSAPGRYVPDKYVPDKYVRVMQEAFFSAEAARNILVLRTASGMAMAVASALDALEFPEVVGCIAGDDTIFAAAHTDEEAKRLAEKIHKMVRA